MSRIFWSKKAFLLLSLVLLAWALGTIHLTMLRPMQPFAVTVSQDSLIITTVASDSPEYQSRFQRGDNILQIAGHTVHTPLDIEYHIDGHQAGAEVSVTLERSNSIRLFRTELVPRYSWRFILINTILGLFFWLIGVFVYLREPGNLGARYFAWACVFIGAGIIVYWWGYPYHGTPLGYSHATLFFLCNTLYPAFVVLFAFNYPAPKLLMTKIPGRQWGFFLPGILLFVLMESTYMTAVIQDSPHMYTHYQAIFKIFRIMVLFAILLSIGSLLHSYVNATKTEEQKKLQWIFLGITLGTAPFLFLWNVPQILSWDPVLSEEVTYLLLLITPICVAVSILKHQALDIHVVINRSLVYFIVTGCVLAVYMGVLATAGIVLNDVSAGNSHLIAMAGTLTAALLFTPVKDRVQQIVDKTFYRVKYDYQIARSQFDADLDHVNDHAETITLLMEAIQSAIPIEKSLVSLQWSHEDSPGIYYSQGFGFEELRQFDATLTAQINTLCREAASGPIFLSDLSGQQQGISHFPAWLHDLDIAIVRGLSLDNHMIGYILFGHKSAQNRYSTADMDLIEALIHDALAKLDRIHIHDAWLLARAEHQRVAEMNAFKSEFLSHVSHDLRTPLNAIRWSIRNLLDGIPEQVTEPVEGYLRDMHSCSDHLQSMIEKLLQVTRIDANQITLHCESLAVDQQIQQIRSMFAPLADRKDIRIEPQITDSLFVSADPGYFRECLVNLIDNALKFSPKHSAIQISASIDEPLHEPDMANITVRDEGPGIAAHQQQDIFDQFAQTQLSSRADEGLGLGLYITKKLVELHGGSISLDSTPGQGAAFTLRFPLSTETLK